MNKAVKIFQKVNGNDPTEGATTNYQGGRGYEMTLEEQITSMARLGLIQNTYYESARFIVEKSVNILEQAIIQIPEKVMEEAIIGRNEYQMKFMPILFLVYLSKIQDKNYFEQAFPKVILTAKDLHTFLDLTRKGGIRQGMGRRIRRVINEWLANNMSEKLATRNKNILKEVVNCTRPNPSKIATQNSLFDRALKYIVKGELTLNRAVVLKNTLNTLSSEKRLTQEILDYIDNYQLEMEELKSAIGFLSPDDKQILYEHFIPNFRYAGLLNNLVGIERTFNYQVPENIVKIVSDKIRSINDYKASKVLPFSLINARRMTKVPEWQSALDYMIANVVPSSFNIQDRLMVVVDVSGSMRSSYVTKSLTAHKIAATFGAVVALSNPDKVDLYTVADNCKQVLFDASLSPFELADKISKQPGCCTYFETIMSKYSGQKYILLITDSEQADNFEYRWRKAEKPEGAKVIVWHLVGYPYKISNRPDVIYLYGYSLTLLNVIKNILEDNN